MPSFPHFEMPDFKIPELNLRSFELPTVDLADLDLPSAEQVAAFARDAAFVGVGLAVMTAERARELQQQFVDTIAARFDETRSQVRTGVDTIVGKVAETVKR